jgi:hypothetical protein
MPTLPQPKITSWSISRYGTYSKCPRLAKYKFIDKLKEPGSPAMDRGAAIHKLAEDYVRKGGRLPKELALFKDDFKTLRTVGALPEAQFTFTAKWEPTNWDNWNGAWCRAMADSVVPPIVDAEEPRVRTIDYKTGKVQEDGKYDDQLELYGLSGLISYPTAKSATGELWFLDHGVIIGAESEFLQKDVPKLKKKWEVRVKPMLADTLFKPKPGNHCRWCHFRKANGGPCEF